MTAGPPYDETALDMPLKWQLDGCENLETAAKTLRNIAAELDAYRAAGFELTAPVDGGVLYFTRASRFFTNDARPRLDVSATWPDDRHF